MSAREIATLDMTKDEQQHVRNALLFLRVKLGGWKPVSKLLHFEETTIINVGNGKRTATASMAFRLARAVGVGVDDLLAGKYPERGVCPRCGIQGRAWDRLKHCRASSADYPFESVLWCRDGG